MDDLDKPVVFVIGAGSGVLFVWLCARVMRERIRQSIANDVTGQVASSISQFIPGAGIAVTPEITNSIRNLISFPVADGVLSGVGL